MRTIRLISQRHGDEMDRLVGMKLEFGSVDLLVHDEDCEVYKPDGQLLLRFHSQVVPPGLTGLAAPALRKAAHLSRNRGQAAGWEAMEVVEGKIPGRGYRSYPKLKDGRISKTDYAPPVESGVVGYLDRNSRFPYCRMTEFGIDNPDKLHESMPLLQWVSELFRKSVFDRWKRQSAAIDVTSRDFYLPGTVFTTVTVNRNFQTAVHVDRGDMKSGFGVMLVVSHEGFRGGYLCFPEYGVAVDMRVGDVLFADVHEWHGNTPMLPMARDWERLSLVCYYREKMFHCGDSTEELERAKARVVGDGLYGDKK